MALKVPFAVLPPGGMLAVVLAMRCDDLRLTEWNWVEEVHGKNLLADLEVVVGVVTGGPVGWDLLLAVELVGAIRLLLSTEERRDGGVVGGQVVVLAGHELVKEGSSSVQQKSQRTEVEVGVLHLRLVVSLLAVLGHTLQVVKATGGLGHHAEESAVEVEVVTAVGEEVVSGQGRVGLELV